MAVATYDEDPARDLDGELGDLEGDDVFAVPMRAAHGYDTVDAIPRALESVQGRVHYCSPVGESPVVTEVLADRAAEEVAPSPDAGVVLVGLGSSSKPYARQTCEYHATRMAEDGDYAEVTTAYLLQNPTVECARYNVAADEVVAVPLFFGPTEETAAEIERKLEVDRGGISVADPFGSHPRVVDAVHAEVESRRAMDGSTGAASSFEAGLAGPGPAVATDGDGRAD